MKSVQDIRRFSSGILEPYIFISYSHDDEELELKENIEEGIDFNIEDRDSLPDPEEAVLDDEELSEEFIEDEILLDDEDESIYDNELAEDNLENDNDSFEE